SIQHLFENMSCSTNNDDNGDKDLSNMNDQEFLRLIEKSFCLSVRKILEQKKMKREGISIDIGD
ncbi:unnamed protein product, partial [Didymodactylos carnosus]